MKHINDLIRPPPRVVEPRRPPSAQLAAELQAEIRQRGLRRGVPLLVQMASGRGEAERSRLLQRALVLLRTGQDPEAKP